MNALAEKYKVDISKIADQNRLAVNQELLIGQQIIIPGAIKITPPKVVPKIATETPSKKLVATKTLKAKIAKSAPRSYAV